MYKGKAPKGGLFFLIRTKKKESALLGALSFCLYKF